MESRIALNQESGFENVQKLTFPDITPPLQFRRDGRSILLFIIYYLFFTLFFWGFTKSFRIPVNFLSEQQILVTYTKNHEKLRGKTAFLGSNEILMNAGFIAIQLRTLRGISEINRK